MGVSLLLLKFGITGTAADVAGFFLRRVVGLFAGYGIYAIDLTNDSWRAAVSLKQYRKEIYPAYQKARARLYTEEEKREIRKEFLRITKHIVRDGLRAQPNP